MIGRRFGLFQHTAARRRLGGNPKQGGKEGKVSTHSRPKAAGAISMSNSGIDFVSTHSRPKAAGTDDPKPGDIAMWFQHTAARRRLG